MANKDFVVKNGLVTGTNNVTAGNTLYVVSNGNIGFGNSTPADKLSVGGKTYFGDSISSGINLTANSTGVYHTGTINAASHTVGTSTVANSTGVYTGVVNGSSITVGTSTISNSTGIYTGVVNGSSITVGTSTIANSTGVYTGVVNATTISTGSVNVLNASGLTTSANISVGAAGEIILTAGAGISANGEFGSAGQVLHSNGSSVYWSTDDQGVTSVASGNGISGGTITSTGTLSVLAGTGTVVNATGVHVNATYIGTLTSNNTSFVGSVSAANVVSNSQLSSNLANYQTTAGLSANVATLTANNTSFVGSVSAANVVSNSQLSSNLANYQTTAGLNANIASYLPNYSGVINATAINSANLSTTTNNVTIGSSSYFVSNGNIGVGTASPTEKLEVNGNLKVSDNIILNGDNITPFAGFKNKIINGNFDFWQRGTSVTGIANGQYLADRWATSRLGTTGNISRQSFTLGQTDVPGEPTYFHRSVVTSVAGAGNYLISYQSIESVRTFAGQTATLSFWAKADASKNMAVEFQQNFGSSGGSPSALVTGIGVTTCALTTSWQKFTITVNIPSISGKTLGSDNNDSFSAFFWFDAGSSFNSRTNSLGQQSGTFDIAQVQIEAGSVATPFEMRPQQVELALCQRYFSSTTLFVGQSGFFATSYTFSSTMRVTPTRTGGGAGYDQSLLNSYGICFAQTTAGQQAFTFDAEI